MGDQVGIEITSADCRPAWEFINLEDLQGEQVVALIRQTWRLKKPQIILTVVSDLQRLGEWGTDHGKHMQDLVIGLGRTVTSARTWLITNGIDLGSSMTMARCLSDVKLWQKAVGEEANQSICMGK